MRPPAARASGRARRGDGRRRSRRRRPRGGECRHARGRRGSSGAGSAARPPSARQVRRCLVAPVRLAHRLARAVERVVPHEPRRARRGVSTSVARRAPRRRQSPVRGRGWRAAPRRSPRDRGALGERSPATLPGERTRRGDAAPCRDSVEPEHDDPRPCPAPTRRWASARAASLALQARSRVSPSLRVAPAPSTRSDDSQPTVIHTCRAPRPRRVRPELRRETSARGRPAVDVRRPHLAERVEPEAGSRRCLDGGSTGPRDGGASRARGVWRGSSSGLAARASRTTPDLRRSGYSSPNSRCTGDFGACDPGFAGAPPGS